MSRLKTNVNSIVFVAAAAPAQNTAAGFAALDWVLAPFHATVPALGGTTHELVTAADLRSGYNVKTKGIADYGQVPLAFTLVEGDDGQELIESQSADPMGALSIKVVYASGDNGVAVTGDALKYQTGIVHSYTPNDGDAATARGFTATFEPQAAVVLATQPA